MTVAELIELLKPMPQNSIVIIQSDAEGNGYSPLSEVGEDNYVADSTWSGHMADDEREEEDEDEFEEDNSEEFVPCVVLVPVN